MKRLLLLALLLCAALPCRALVQTKPQDCSASCGTTTTITFATPTTAGNLVDERIVTSLPFISALCGSISLDLQAEYSNTSASGTTIYTFILARPLMPSTSSCTITSPSAWTGYAAQDEVASVNSVDLLSGCGFGGNPPYCLTTASPTSTTGGSISVTAGTSPVSGTETCVFILAGFPNTPTFTTGSGYFSLTTDYSTSGAVFSSETGVSGGSYTYAATWTAGVSQPTGVETCYYETTTPTVLPVILVPAGGNYHTAPSPVGSTGTIGAVVHYNTSTTAGCGDSTTPPTFSTTTTVSAIACATGFNNSPAVTETYTIIGGSPTTYYIRPDGGTAYFASGFGGYIVGMCNGTTDAAYPGTTNHTWLANTAYSLGDTFVANDGTSSHMYYWSVTTAGTSQASYWPNFPAGGVVTDSNGVVYTQGSAAPMNANCAWDDFRFTYSNNAYDSVAVGWIPAGGDTVIVRGCFNVDEVFDGSTACLMGPSPYPHVDYWCGGVSTCSNANPPPSGTSGQHTRFLSSCAAAGTCPIGSETDPSLYAANLQELWGDIGNAAMFNVEQLQYVDLWGFNIDQHANCSHLGATPYPHACGSSDNWMNIGLLTDYGTGYFYLQDDWIHGMRSSGIAGAVGNGPISLTRVNDSFNTFAGWDGNGAGQGEPNGPNAAIVANYVTMEGNGCNEQWPIVNTTFAANSCYDLISDGFGDAWSGQTVTPIGQVGPPSYLTSFTCNHCAMIYNTKDGFIGPHTIITALDIENSISGGNGGEQWKWGTRYGGSTTFLNNLTVGNCFRMWSSTPIPGASGAWNNTTLTGTPTGYPGAYLDNPDGCRASGDGFSFSTAAAGSVLFGNSTWVGYNPVVYDLACVAQYECGSSIFTFVDNLHYGIIAGDLAGYVAGFIGQQPTIYYPEDPTISITSSHELEYGTRNGSCPGGTCVSTDPLLINEPPTTTTTQAQLDVFLANMNQGFYLSSNSSPAAPANGNGTSYTGQPSVSSTQCGPTFSYSSPFGIGACGIYVAPSTSGGLFRGLMSGFFR